MKANQVNINNLLPQGVIIEITKKLGMSQLAVSAALERDKSGHPVVRFALRMAQESGALDAAKTLSSLLA